MTWAGEFRKRDLWLEWSDMLHALFWEGAGKPMSDEWSEWNDFRAERYRALMEGGKEGGFTAPSSRSSPEHPIYRKSSTGGLTMPKKANSAFMKPLTPSAELAKVTGAEPLPRSEVAKKLWAYINDWA